MSNVATENPGKTSNRAVGCRRCNDSLRGPEQRVNLTGSPVNTQQPGEKTLARPRSYPRTLIFENDSTARPGVGLPIDMAGRNVVKISILFTSGSSFCVPSGSEMIR
jgi:hypothetical protein